MSTFDSNEHTDDACDKPEKSILRSSDIVPPYDGKPVAGTPKRDNSRSQPSKETINSDGTGEKTNPEQEIPKFNLAEQIMAEQRKVVSLKRRAPAEQPCPVNDRVSAEPSEKTAEKTDVALDDSDSVIAGIVARDIAALCNT